MSRPKGELSGLFSDVDFVLLNEVIDFGDMGKGTILGGLYELRHLEPMDDIRYLEELYEHPDDRMDKK